MSQLEWLLGLGRNKLDILCVCSVHAQGWFVKFFLKINHYFYCDNQEEDWTLILNLNLCMPALNSRLKKSHTVWWFSERFGDLFFQKTPKNEDLM